MASSSAAIDDRRRPTGGHRTVAARPRLFGTAGGAGRGRAPARPAQTVRRREAAQGFTRGKVVLDIQNLRTYFFTYDGVVRALEGINLQARSGETTGVVGETGCGKSVTAFSVARLVSEPGRVISGRILLNGVNLLWGLEKEAKFTRQGNTGRVKVIRRYRQIRFGNERMSSVRGRGIGMIFQEPTQAMNPVFSLADQLGEAVMLHEGVELLDQILKADRAAPSVGYISEAQLGEEEQTSTSQAPTGLGEEVEGFLRAAASGDQDQLRAAAQAIGRTVGLPTIETQLFYLGRSGGKDTARLRRQALRALQRVYLTGFQRRYIRHLRRLEVLRRRTKDLYFQEMKLERLQRVARGGVALQIRFERLRHFYYGIWGFGRRLYRPVKNELFWRAVQLLESVRIANPAQIARGYPHELSGGMLQRAMIAMALSCEPGLLLADEPTTALDVTIQAQILELMRQLRERVGTAIVLITHDLGVVAEVCDHVNVMYAGVIVENGPVTEVFRRPLHPYTHGLLASIPRFDQPDRQLQTIPGAVPNLIHPPPGCRFHPRCPYAMPVCKEVRPLPQDQGGGHMVACHLYGGEETAPSSAPSGVPAEQTAAPLARPTA